MPYIYLSVLPAGSWNSGATLTTAFLTSLGNKPSGPNEFETVEFYTAEDIGQMMGGN